MCLVSFGNQEFMASEGIDLNPREECSKDPYNESRKQPPRSYNTPSDFDKLRQFLVMDRKVLRFYCVWDDRDSMFGEMKPNVSIMATTKHFFFLTTVFPLHWSWPATPCPTSWHSCASSHFNDSHSLMTLSTTWLQVILCLPLLSHLPLHTCHNWNYIFLSCLKCN